MSEHPSLPPRQRSVSILLGAGFSLLIGALGLVLAVVGFMGKGGKADMSTALPNLITGIASIAGAVAYLRLKKWAIPVYVVAVAGHFVTHAMLYTANSAAGHMTTRGIVILSFVPVLALIVLISMVWQQRSGILA